MIRGHWPTAMWRGVFRSAGVRLAVSYAAVFGISALVLVVVLRSTTIGLLNGQVDAAIRADALGLAERWQDGGPQALLATIGERLAGNVDEDAIYLVIDPQGQPIAGNLAAWPGEVQETGPIYELPVHELSFRRHGADSLARLHRFALPNGYALLVGRDVASRAALRDLLTHTLGWALLLVIALSVLGAILVRRLFHRMLSHISATAAAISAGDLSPRVQLSGRGDEFDRLAETINDMLDRIGRLMDGVRQVSNAIAHDLRTPITRARARLEDAADHAYTSDDFRTEIGHAIQDLDNVTAIFQALLRISEIEAGARRSAFTQIDLEPLLQDLSELYTVVAEEAGLALYLTLAGPLSLRGDRTLVQQAVANLLDNALKFSSPGSTVRLSGRRTASGIELSVTDTGPGIPPVDIPRATERFFRGESARHAPGFGLGLTLVRAVAQLHGGALALQDAKPGLRALLTLPAVQDPAPLSFAALQPRAPLPAERQHEHVAMGR